MIDSPVEVVGVPVQARNKPGPFLFSLLLAFLPPLSHAAFGAYHRSLFK